MTTTEPTPEQIRDFAKWCEKWSPELAACAPMLRDYANHAEHERDVENLAHVLSDSAKPCVDLPDGQVLAVARLQARAVLAFQAEERAANRLAELDPDAFGAEGFSSTDHDPSADPAEAWDRREG